MFSLPQFEFLFIQNIDFVLGKWAGAAIDRYALTEHS
tara:strand:- start:125 stop:235 length:111 start_codon:yes stop_codon:yes gene_type:complete